MGLKKYKLAIAVKEPEYLKRLADYVRDGPFEGQWQVIAFTHAEAIKQYVKQGYKFDLLAAQPDLLHELKNDQNDVMLHIPIATLVLKLTENDKETQVLQFQSLPSLLQRLSEIRASFSIAHAPSMARDEASFHTRVITVLSAAGGVGKTAVAMHLVQAASSHSKRTFYLNLEQWNTSDAWLGYNDINESAPSEGLSELLYELKSQPEQLFSWLTQHRKRHPLLNGDYLSPCSNMEDRMTLTAEDASSILGVIVQSRQYDLIVIDLDSGLNDLHKAMIEQANQVLWVMDDSLSALNKQKLALQYGEQKWGELFARLISKFEYIKNRAVLTEHLTDLEGRIGLETVSIPLPEVPEWRVSNGAKLLSSPLFRASVERLFKYLVKEGGGGHC